MADFGARWNYATADRRTPSPSPKRPRRDYERTYDDRGGWGGREGDQLTTSSDLLRNGLSFAGLSSDLGLSGVGLGVSGAASLSALGAGLSALDDSSLITQTSQMMGYDVACLAGARSNLNINTGDGLPHDASSTLFVDGLPSDCTRREAAHIFRPFIGFKEVRLVHKDAKRATGEKLVLCFVEFMDAKCAATALEALQGYKFDENDPDSYVLRLTFARYGPRGAPRSRSPLRVRDRAQFANNTNNNRRDRRR
ncbi:nuclear speckle RNA-binding protein A isoform X2 [Selaginella moellendorffii]|nr:nuclear speckle RNA-binding protein A isoform X2 [Selaginella moellendorffii]|eukprot:XP_002974737.2 nuclear speckle RNA-binding protein A isoform X2 [Selaginella moellendorffii]